MRKGVKQYVIAIVLLITFIVAIEFTSGFSSAGTFFFRLFVGLIFIYTVKVGINEPKLFNPYLLFSLTPLSLLLYNHVFSPYYLLQLSSKTWLIGIINMVGFVFALKASKPINSTPIVSMVLNDNKGHLAASKFNATKHSLFLFFIGFFSTIYSLITGRVFFLASVFAYAFYLALCTSLKYRLKIVTTGIILYLCFSIAQGFNKSYFLAIITTVIVALEKYYATSKKQKIILVVLIAVVSTFMLLVAFPLKDYMTNGGSFLEYFRRRSLNTNVGFSITDRVDFSIPSFLRIPYMYFVSEWTNLQFVMETQSSHTYGLWFLKPVLGYLQLDNLFVDKYNLSPFAYAFNTFGYITVQYKDFGLIGSVFGSLFLGWFTKKTYSLYLISDSPLWLGCYAMTACAVIEMFFSNHFFMQSYPFTIVLLCLLYRFVFKSSKKL